jgi:hypothetical protein
LERELKLYKANPIIHYDFVNAKGENRKSNLSSLERKKKSRANNNKSQNQIIQRQFRNGDFDV